MTTAYIRTPSPDMASACELTFMDRTPINIDLALRQHHEYATALRRAGASVITLPPLNGHPDCAFIEDALICLPEILIATRPGASSREAEAAAAVSDLNLSRLHAEIVPAGTLEGGDVLRIGKTLFVGLTTRTNQAGIEQLASLVAPFGYNVVPVPIGGALHLKTAVTSPIPGLLVGNRNWVDPLPFGDMQFIDIATEEPFAGNVLTIGTTAILPAAHLRTAERIAPYVDCVILTDISEFAKAEAGVTCLSVIDA